MLTGHASHQIGLDVDIWLTPMPPRELSRAEREDMSATNMVREDGLDVIPIYGRRAISPSCGPPPRTRRAADFRQCGDQAGDVPRRRRRTLDAQGAPYYSHTTTST